MAKVKQEEWQSIVQCCMIGHVAAMAETGVT